MMPLERRHAAIEATMAKFRDQPFQWGQVDCARIAAFHLRQLGYKIAISKAGRYRTALGAAKALGRLGYSSLAEMADGLGLMPITPARMLLGDVAEVEGDSPVGTIALYAGSGNVFAFHEDHPGLVTAAPHAASILRAWSVL
ncbi:hypothetical protein EDF57_103529 [Novosphingobium sp. PhB55]|uniref:DUF6950 family protein n=1 Tax=Novosphingobium sp. PhB55 TaxID=2485106 RepID=UPI0010653F51|nr:hypothetical protein [Novosphingobium sp. PhB55]TDW65345.1 hypothetical protein EDF57_103529 [Novosphingobium sp. PhB55]